jgi:hypothetical protein
MRDSNRVLLPSDITPDILKTAFHTFIINGKVNSFIQLTSLILNTNRILLEKGQVHALPILQEICSPLNTSKSTSHKMSKLHKFPF